MGKWLEKIQEVGHDMLIPNLFSFFFYANGKLGKQIGFGPKKAQNGYFWVFSLQNQTSSCNFDLKLGVLVKKIVFNMHAKIHDNRTNFRYPKGLFFGQNLHIS